MKQTLIDLFTSKKFLAAATAVIVYVAGRFGFDVDTATLDRIYAALLAYVGAQGLADMGKGAAQVRAANDNAAAAPRASGQAGAGVAAASAILLLLAVAGGTGACAEVQPRARAANGLEAGLDCTAPAIAPVVTDLGASFKAWALKHVAGDDRAIGLAKLKRDAAALKGELVSSCALVAALALLATPARAPEPQGLLATAPGPTPEEWGVVLAEVRAELGVRPAP